MSQAIGVLHPGAMGASVIKALAAKEHRVFWCAAGRSEETRLRADVAGSEPCGSLTELALRCDVIVSVCPPESALEVGRSVVAAGFNGLYADFNAIAPQRAQEVAGLFPGCYVDGGIIGPPASVVGTTRLYLSGRRAQEIAALFSDTALEPIVLTGSERDPEHQQKHTAASALKMSYASWTKGSAALLLSTRALAEAFGVGEALESEWALSQSGTLERAEATVAGVAPKAWRFSGEMREIAATFEAAGLPADFHLGAAEFYSLLSQFKDQSGVSLSVMLSALDAVVKKDASDRLTSSPVGSRNAPRTL